MLGPIEPAALALEIVEQLVEAFAPVFGAEDEEEVVAADVADEVAGGVDAFVEALGEAEQDFVATAVAVDVVEGFEAVDVDVADDRFAGLLQQAGEALLDRYVARQQGEGIGVARLLDFQFGDQLQHVDHPAEAEVTAVEGDNEVFFDALAGAAGDQAADLLQRLADFHGEEIIVHQAADRFAREQIGGKRFEQCVRQRVAMDDAAGLALFVEHSE